MNTRIIKEIKIKLLFHLAFGMHLIPNIFYMTNRKAIPFQYISYCYCQTIFPFIGHFRHICLKGQKTTLMASNFFSVQIYYSSMYQTTRMPKSGSPSRTQTDRIPSSPRSRRTRFWMFRVLLLPMALTYSCIVRMARTLKSG